MTQSSEKPRRPNILVITCDQWRGDSIGGISSVVRTPNVDALAREGVTFRRHYAGSAPCGPARACLYTGLYQMTNRVCSNGTPLDARHDTMAFAARRAGYDPTLFGYTDVSPDPRLYHPNDPNLKSYEGVLPGFSVRVKLSDHRRVWLSWLKARGRDVSMGSPEIHIPPGTTGKLTNSPPVYSKDETETAFMVGEFIRWLGEQDAEKPWFAHVSLIRPHPPFVVPAPYNTMYGPDNGPGFSRAGSLEAEAALHPYNAFALDSTLRKSFVPGLEGRVADMSDDEFKMIRAIYRGMISEVDDQLGRIWSELRAAGAWEDTIIVFTSDHAELMGDHFMLGKGGFFDGSYHIPLVVRDPRRKTAHGRVVERFTEAVDIMPTLLESMGLPVGAHLDGRTLSPFLDGSEPAAWRDAAYWEHDFRSVATGRAEKLFGLESSQLNLAVVRTDRHKYVHFGGGLPPVLFDLAEDPAETRNRVDDPAYARVRLEMAERLLEWRARHLDQSLALSALAAGGVVGELARGK